MSFNWVQVLAYKGQYVKTKQNKTIAKKTESTFFSCAYPSFLKGRSYHSVSRISKTRRHYIYIRLLFQLLRIELVILEKRNLSMSQFLTTKFLFRNSLTSWTKNSGNFLLDFKENFSEILVSELQKVQEYKFRSQTSKGQNCSALYMYRHLPSLGSRRRKDASYKSSKLERFLGTASLASSWKSSLDRFLIGKAFVIDKAITRQRAIFNISSPLATSDVWAYGNFDLAKFFQR